MSHSKFALIDWLYINVSAVQKAYKLIMPAVTNVCFFLVLMHTAVMLRSFMIWSVFDSIVKW